MLKNAIEEIFVILASGKRHKFSSDVFMVDLRKKKFKETPGKVLITRH